MSDLDGELQGRLARLASAVPVSRSRLDPVHRQAVVARQQVRLAWATPLAIIATGILLAGVLRVGPFAPGSTADAGPVEASTRSGPFNLSLQAEHGVVAAGEPIDVVAKLTYLGTESVTISHAFGADRSPIAFGIEEPIFGDHRLAPVWETACTATTIENGAPLAEPFAKMANSLDPLSTELTTFLRDPVLRLPPGTWHLYTVAWFTQGECRDAADSDAAVEMRVEIPVTVTGVSSVDPSNSDSPEPTTAASPEATGAIDTDEQANFRLELGTPKTSYLETEPINVSGALTYLGTEPMVISGLALGYSIDPPVFGMSGFGGTTIRICANQSLDPGERFEAPFIKGSPILDGEPMSAAKQAFLADPLLRLPPGTWQLTLTSTFTSGRTCGVTGAGMRYSLRATIEIRVRPHVVDPRATEPPARPTEPPSDASPIDIDADGTFELQVHAPSRTVRAGDPVELETTWRYIGEEPASIDVGHFQPEVAFSLEQLDVDGQILRSKVYDSACTARRMTSGISRDVAISDGNLMTIKAMSLPGGFDTLLDQGIVSLLPGRWRITAWLSASTDAACRTAVHALTASVEIVVVKSTWQRMPIQTADHETGVCLLMTASGVLAPEPSWGIGVTGADGSLHPVIWGFGWSGWRSPDGVVLIDRDGKVVAREGDRLSWDGGLREDGTYTVCAGLSNAGP